ncbi:MAG: ATP-binding protein [Vicinamibacterales bacterium]
MSAAPEIPPAIVSTLLNLVGEFTFAYVVDRQHGPRLEWSNISFEDWTGRSLEDWTSLAGWFAFIHQDDRAAVLDAFERANAGARTEFEFRMEGPSGLRWTRFTLQPILGADGRVERVCGATRDLTLHRQADADVRSREQQLRQVLDALPIGVWFVDRRGRVRDVNAAGRRMWGGGEGVDVTDVAQYERYNVRRATSGELLSPSRNNLVEALEHGRATIDQDIEVDLPDGSRRTLQSSVFPMHEADGSISGAIVVNADVTGARRLEAQMRQGQRMESIGRMAGGIAHDFNNLLTVIVGCAEIALQFGKGGDSTPEWEETLAAARRAAELTRQLLAFSRQQPVAPRIVDLSSVVRRVEALLRRVLGEDVRLMVDCSPETLPVNIDPGQFEQILINLAANARDAMPGGGTVSVRTTLHVVTQAEARRHPGLTPGAKVRLSVSDTGVGIPEDIRNRIFEPFFTTKGPGKGTGLGLSMCYGTVKQASGYIGVESAEGKGSTFWIYLPLVEGAVTDVGEETVPRAERRDGSARVLLVEDEPAVADLTRRALEFGGYSVTVAGNGTEALTILSELREPVDLLLTDVMMPDMRGTMLAKRVRVLYPELPVMFVSGYPGPLEEEFKNARLLAKPFSPGELLKQVGEALKPRVEGPAR